MTVLQEDYKRITGKEYGKDRHRRLPMHNFTDLVTDARATTRTCAEDGCAGEGRYVKGYYLVGHRRVRVWVCKEHQVCTSNRVLPTPPSVQAALDAEREHQEKMARLYQWEDARDDSRSVRELASTGFGKQIAFDRVASFRWEPTPRRKGEKRG